jgi:hypothetical protein
MNELVLTAVLTLAIPGLAQEKPAPTLKSVLLQQLRSTHTNSEWFVCVKVAVDGLTPEQAKWTDGKGNHSVGQLANHLLFWNRQQLATLKNAATPKYTGSNDETFNSFDAKSWNATVQQLDAVLTELEQLVETVDDARLKSIAGVIAHINTHNAYHIGQMVIVRKAQSIWDPDKGVR